MKQPLSLRYWAADHPAVAAFRWDYGVLGASWPFLFLALLSYFLLIAFLRFLLLFRRSPLPLGPFPALYNLSLLLGSCCMFVGCLQAAQVEIQETRWFWRRSKTTVEWMLCFPLGTRPVGRVFFWSYVFYLSKYYEFLDNVLIILQKRPLGVARILKQALVVMTCFLWLEFSQSLQILAILADTGLHMVVYLHLFLASVANAPPWQRLVRHCGIAQFVFMAFASAGLLLLHFRREGCNGMGSWVFTALLNASILPLLLGPATQERQCERKEAATKERQCEHKEESKRLQ